ncbi:MAG: alpha/beta hydrolase [Pseudomonadota bacterium]
MTLAPAPLTSKADDFAPDWFRSAIAQTPRSSYIDADGNRLHYLAWNPEETHKPVLLFVHGFRAHARWWGFIAPFFTQTHRVMAMDMSGMGDSGWRDSYTPYTMSDDIIALAEVLSKSTAPGISPITVVAHSYGGLCSFRAASQRPELFARLVIMDTFVIFENVNLPTDPAPITGRLYADAASARKRYRLLPEQSPPQEYVLDYIAHHSIRAVEGGYRWKFDTRLQAQDSHLCDGGEMLARVTTPVDYLCGERSALVTPAHAARIIDALQNVRGPIVVPGGQHHLMLDQPITVIGILRALLAAHKQEPQPI